MHPEIEQLFSLTGRTALVTGGAVHLGFDAASALAASGCDLIITSRSQQRADASAQLLQERYGVSVLALQMDQKEIGEIEAVVERATAWRDRIDILINNAGGAVPGRPGSLFERTPEDVRNLIDTNLLGTLYCCREVGRHMVEQGSGKIINIASIAGMVGRDRKMYHEGGITEQPIEYAAAKAGIIGLTRDLAGAFSPKGVMVNTISPGGFERGQAREFVERYSARTPLGRMGRDGIDLKGAIVFLASPASDYVTGINLVVDGGFTIWR